MKRVWVYAETSNPGTSVENTAYEMMEEPPFPGKWKATGTWSGEKPSILAEKLKKEQEKEEGKEARIALNFKPPFDVLIGEGGTIFPQNARELNKEEIQDFLKVFTKL